MSKQDPKLILQQIENYALWAQELATQNDLCGMLMNWQKRAAFERVMEVLGQNIKRLPAELSQRHPAVPWQTWVNLGEQVSTSTDGIDYATLWKTAGKETPGLLTTVRQILEDLKTAKPS